MQRRMLVALPGIAALAASRAFGESTTATHVSRKSLSKHSGTKASYKFPKSAAKQAKYVNSLSVLLSLTSGQQTQVASILASASGSRATLSTSTKDARAALTAAVRNNDSAAISKAATSIGSLTSQHISLGAHVHAAIIQTLTPEQQAKLSQVQG
jgi:Spy/CpxP family protein refolding chaperone